MGPRTEAKTFNSHSTNCIHWNGLIKILCRAIADKMKDAAINSRRSARVWSLPLFIIIIIAVQGSLVWHRCGYLLMHPLSTPAPHIKHRQFVIYRIPCSSHGMESIQWITLAPTIHMRPTERPVWESPVLTHTQKRGGKCINENYIMITFSFLSIRPQQAHCRLTRRALSFPSLHINISSRSPIRSDPFRSDWITCTVVFAVAVAHSFSALYTFLTRSKCTFI